MRRHAMVAMAAIGLTAVIAGGAPASAGGAIVTDGAGPDFTYASTFAHATFEVHGVQTPSGKTIVTLDVSGVPELAGQTFGAHVHQNACGATGTAAGPHFTHPEQFSGQSLEDREIWLNFTVGEDGTAHSKAKRDWVFTSTAKSVIVHAEETSPAGTAGARLACTDAVFF